MVTIAYLGPPGTFSEEAAVSHGGAGATYLPLASIPAVVTAIETGAATAGVLPIENVLEGSVPATLDLLIHETDLRINGETRPCERMDEARPGLRHALTPPWRGGAYGEVLDDGEIELGAPVEWAESKE